MITTSEISEVFKTWILRKLMNISWMQNTSNAKVLEQAGVSYLSHVLRGKKFTFRMGMKAELLKETL